MSGGHLPFSGMDSSSLAPLSLNPTNSGSGSRSQALPGFQPLGDALGVLSVKPGWGRAETALALEGRISHANFLSDGKG